MTSPCNNQSDALDAIKRVVGDQYIRAASEADAINGVTPRWIVDPATTAELSQVLSLANAAGLRVVPRGSGSKIDWGNPPRGVDIVVSTERMNRVIEHAAADMTATVQAGCSVADFAAVLAERGQRLALDPLWPGRVTIGGIVATNDSGALRAAFGTLRDHLIGITVVLADGTIARSGGKVVKNVAGYDLPKLFTGSFGTLGVIAEATFRLYPLAHASRSLRFTAHSHDALGPMLTALADCALVTSAVQIDVADGGVAGVLVSVEGLLDAIGAKVERVVRAATACGAAQVEVEPGAWSARERLFADPGSWVAKVSLLPTEWPGFIDLVREIAGKNGVQWQIIGQAVGVGLLRLISSARERVFTVGSALADPTGTIARDLAPSPSYSGERAGVRGRAAGGGGSRKDKSDNARNAVADVPPLTPALSPEYEGEGAVDGGSPLSIRYEQIAVVRALRTHLAKTGGTLTLLRCRPATKARVDVSPDTANSPPQSSVLSSQSTVSSSPIIDVWPDVGNALPLMRRIKEQFDPRGILSPGRFVGGI